ncbi:MAG: hypothetical protein II093_05135, partial [Selenomonas sp.]|nr:hypothetical protein [Selenomonas sp.]
MRKSPSAVCGSGGRWREGRDAAQRRDGARGRMRAGRGGYVSAAAVSARLGQRGGSGAEHEAAGVGGHLEA